MYTLARTALGLACALGSVAASAPAQYGATLELKITAHATAKPLSGARVDLPGIAVTARTDPQGRVRVPAIPPGTHLVAVSLPGFATERLAVELSRGQMVEGEIALLALPADAAGGTGGAAARGRFTPVAAGFAPTQASHASSPGGSGPDRRQEGKLLLSDLLRGRRGTGVMPSDGGYVAVSTRGPVAAARPGPCRPPVYLDGARIHGAQLDALHSPGAIAAAEVFAGPATSPPRFSHPCGAILLWSRTR